MQNTSRMHLFNSTGQAAEEFKTWVRYEITFTCNEQTWHKVNIGLMFDFFPCEK